MHRLLLLAALFTPVSAGPLPVGNLDDPMRDGGSRTLRRPPYMPPGPDIAPLKKPKTFARQGDQLRGWFTQIPNGTRVPTPTVHRGQVLISGGSASHEFYSLALVTGFSLWQYRTQDNAPSAAAADGDHVAFTTESCEVEVLSTEGKPLWKRWLGSEMLSMPSIADGLLYVGYPAETRSQISAFTIGTGEEVWSMPLASELLSAPVIQDGKVIVTVADGTVQCLEGKSGETLWRSPMKATAAPIVAGGFAFMPVRAPGGPETLLRRSLGSDETSLTFPRSRCRHGTWRSPPSGTPEARWTSPSSRPRSRPSITSA